MLVDLYEQWTHEEHDEHGEWLDRLTEEEMREEEALREFLAGLSGEDNE